VPNDGESMNINVIRAGVTFGAVVVAASLAYVWFTWHHSNAVIFAPVKIDARVDIERNWVFISRELKWEDGPKELEQPRQSCNNSLLLIFYPSGAFASVGVSLERSPASQVSWMAAGGGYSVAKGTWIRNSDGTVTTTSRFSHGNKLRRSASVATAASRTWIVQRPSVKRLADVIESDGEVFVPAGEQLGNFDFLNEMVAGDDDSKIGERTSLVPNDFKQIDFKNYAFPYKDYNGKRRNVPLKNGEYEYDFADERGWFTFEDVAYVDMTNDGRSEAIVMLEHVTCGASCDGGAGLFYIFSAQRNKLESLWQYETGSGAYGCGLKSIIVKGGRVNLELFGRCIHGNNPPAGLAKFLVKDLTRIAFGWNGREFVTTRKKIIASPVRDLKNYLPVISIHE
jgi:hypothetical protein